MFSSGVSLQPVPYFADLTISIAWCSVWFMGSFFKQCLHISLVDTIDRPSQVTLLVMRLQEMDINSFVNSLLWWLWNSNRPEDDASSLLIFRHVQVNSVAVSGHKTAWRYVSYIIHARSCTPTYSIIRSFFIFLASAGDQIGTAESCLVQVPNISNDVIESSEPQCGQIIRGSPCLLGFYQSDLARGEFCEVFRLYLFYSHCPSLETWQVICRGILYSLISSRTSFNSQIHQFQIFGHETLKASQAPLLLLWLHTFCIFEQSKFALNWSVETSRVLISLVLHFLLLQGASSCWYRYKISWCYRRSHSRGCSPEVCACEFWVCFCFSLHWRFPRFPANQQP